MDARSYVLAEGESCCGWGRLVRTAEGDWFDPPLPIPAIGYGRDGRPAPRPSKFKTPVEGADFDAVQGRYERGGAIEGYAKIHGTWLGDRIRVSRQTNQPPERRWPTWSDPPCAPPPGGWPHGVLDRDGMEFDLGDLEDTGAAVTVVIFRPSADHEVVVVTATDIAAVEARLRPQLGDRLCVVPSRWTRAQLDQAREHLTAMADRWGIYQLGPHCDEQAQATMTATLVRVTDEIADWVVTQPGGLVSLDPRLIPESLVSPDDGDAL
ncbi:MAG TPA: hypothetical protein VE441_07545 [Mycobacterium sp.]|nr:hypothetical protein [Mycobacterium sp.]